MATSRERALAALNHEETDRPCIDFGATMATGISAVVYDEAKRQLGYDTITTVEDVGQQLAEIEPFMREEMGGDFVCLRRYAPASGIPITGYKESTLTNGRPALQPLLYNPRMREDGALELTALPHPLDYVHPYKKGEDDNAYLGEVVCRCPKGFHAYARLFHPMEHVETMEEFEQYVYPEMTDVEYTFYAETARRLRETTDKAVTGIFLGNVFEMGQLYWGYENFFVLMGIDPELTHAFMEKRTQVYMRDLEKYLKAAGEYLDVIQFNDDLGTQNTLLISPQMYREYVKPYHMRMFQYVRQNYPHIKVFFHTCGAVYDIIPDLIECGVQILNPIQISAVGMDPARLKKEFGKELVFWGGGVDTQNVLGVASPEGVRAQVEEMLSILSPGGGYVFSQVHNVNGSVPAENLITCFKTAQNWRK